MRRTTLTSLALVGSLSAASSAGADAVFGTRSSELVEVDHDIELKIDHGHATLVVRRTFKNGGKKHDQAMVHIDDLPAGAVATGLRTLATKDGQPIRYAGELLEAELAAKRYQELTGIGGYYPKDPALLSWRHQGLLYLQVFPVDPGGKKTVEYTFEAPTQYLEGRDVFRLPKMGTPTLHAHVTVAPAHVGDTLHLGVSPVASGAKLNADLGVDLAVTRDPTTQPKLGGSAASVWFGKGRTLLHTAIEVAPKLSTVPSGASVVVILDGSRSLSDAQRSAELAAARAYLEHFVAAGDATVLVLTFARKVAARQESFVPVKDALADLAKLTIKPGNGSAIDEALSEAKRRLAAQPAKSAKRVLVLTDLRTRAAITPESTAAISSATGAVVHLATIDQGMPAIDRDDDSSWAKVTRPTGGVFWRASASAESQHATAMRTVYEEWARPVRVDRIALTAVGITASALGLPSTMKEGQGFEDLRITSFGPPALGVAGELWSTPIKTLIEPKEQDNRLWSALFFGSAILNQLTEPEMMTLAMKGRAVSPVTSYLAIEPGVRPSTEGLEVGEGSAFGGGGGFGVLYGGHSANAVSIDLFDRGAFLRGELAKAFKACGGGTRTTSVRFETTLREIVSVHTSTLSGIKDDTLKSCVEEAAWAIDLPAGFREDWAAWDVSLPGDAK